MADKRITDLPELVQADSGDFIPIVDSSMNVTKKVAAEKVLPNGSVVPSLMALSKSVDGNGWTVYNYGTFKKYAKNYQITTSTPVNAGNVGAVLSPGKTPEGQAMGFGDVYVTSGVRVPHTASSTAAALQAQPRWDATVVGGDIAVILANPTNTNLNAQYYWISIEVTTL